MQISGPGTLLAAVTDLGALARDKPPRTGKAADRQALLTLLMQGSSPQHSPWKNSVVRSCRTAAWGKKSDSHATGDVVRPCLLLDRRSRAMLPSLQEPDSLASCGRVAAQL